MKSYLNADYRCQCGKLLFRGLILKDILNTKCPRCNALSSFKGVGVFDNENRVALLCAEDGKIVNASASLQEIFGYAVEDVIGKKVDFLFSSEVAVMADGEVSKLAMTKDYYRLDSTYKKLSGETVPVTVRYKSIYIGDKKLLLRIVDLLPVNGDVQSNLELLDHRQVGDFVAETSVDNTILYISPEAVDIFGFRPEEIIGHKVQEFQVLDNEEWRMKNLQNLQLRRVSYRSVDFKSLTKGGQAIIYDAFCVPIYSDSGDYIGYRVVNWLKNKV